MPFTKDNPELAAEAGRKSRRPPDSYKVWKELQESIVGRHTDRINTFMDELWNGVRKPNGTWEKRPDHDKFFAAYERLLPYFKPRQLNAQVGFGVSDQIKGIDIEVIGTRARASALPEAPPIEGMIEAVVIEEETEDEAKDNKTL